METFELHRYDGPATVAGIDFPRVQLWEGAESGTQGVPVIRWWEGGIKCSRLDVPDLTPTAAAAMTEGTVDVVVPNVGEGRAYVAQVTLTDQYLWEVELRGTGPSPLV